MEFEVDSVSRGVDTYYDGERWVTRPSWYIRGHLVKTHLADTGRIEWTCHDAKLAERLRPGVRLNISVSFGES